MVRRSKTLSWLHGLDSAPIQHGWCCGTWSIEDQSPFRIVDTNHAVRFAFGVMIEDRLECLDGSHGLSVGGEIVVGERLHFG
ncbi:MAG: hypothetical protein JWP89_2111 [Schlesneria sp.]|nr:hypothetical protein [Schlesneria sp.]